MVQPPNMLLSPFYCQGDCAGQLKNVGGQQRKSSARDEGALTVTSLLPPPLLKTCQKELAGVDKLPPSQRQVVVDILNSLYELEKRRVAENPQLPPATDCFIAVCCFRKMKHHCPSADVTDLVTKTVSYLPNKLGPRDDKQMSKLHDWLKTYALYESKSVTGSF